MSASVHNQLDDSVALFYQTGYLTIKQYDREDDLYVLGFPNREVSDAFFNYLLPAYSAKNIMETDSYLNQLKEAIANGEPDLAIKVLKEFTTDISYDEVLAPEVESHFQNITYITSRLLLSRNISVKVEQ